MKIDIFCAINLNIYIGIKQSLLCFGLGVGCPPPPVLPVSLCNVKCDIVSAACSYTTPYGMPTLLSEENGTVVLYRQIRREDSGKHKGNAKCK